MDPLLWGWQALKLSLDPMPTSKKPALKFSTDTTRMLQVVVGVGKLGLMAYLFVPTARGTPSSQMKLRNQTYVDENLVLKVPIGAQRILN